MLKYHIQTIEVGSGGAADITFNNIPQDYDDLYLVCSLRGSRADYADYFPYVQFNNSTSGYSSRNLGGWGDSVYSTTSLIGLVQGSSSTANTFDNSAIFIPSYTSTLAKSYSVDSVTENNATNAGQRISAGLWSGTQAITSITLKANFTPPFAQYSSASLYGIKRGQEGALQPPASGGTVTTSGGYTYHTFTSSGTFVANRELQADVLIVAGGGGGGSRHAGGGGAGGYLSGSLQIIPSSSTVTIGSGGAAGPGGGSNTSSAGSSGANSSFNSYTAFGGGGGGGNGFETGRAGGSSGGPRQGYSPVAATQNNQSPLLGFGNTSTVGSWTGAGGGGAGGLGGPSYPNPAGSGGVGKTWLNSITYAGGGGGGGGNEGGAGSGGPGGTGGGGNGGGTSDGASGTANTGGGGGGGGFWSSTSYSGGNGGSGVVIIRYLTPA